MVFVFGRVMQTLGNVYDMYAKKIKKIWPQTGCADKNMSACWAHWPLKHEQDEGRLKHELGQTLSRTAS